ncbi:MAG: coproporphyrinogen dehydrogenase HemZ [Ruminococcus sp.]|nr:coproporphyrinogen dehydrogenase HemZ [Ruminococcus sp.]
MENDNKMPVVLIGNSFKYEVEATCKLFFHTRRYRFSEDPADASGEQFILAKISDEGDQALLFAKVKLSGREAVSGEKRLPASAEKSQREHELCRVLFHLLSDLTGIRPPWGLMTGIRPVKKVTELMDKGLSRQEIEKSLTERFELMPDKLRLAYETAKNQQPILQKIDSGAVSLYVSIPFCPTRCSYCSFVSHSMESAIKLMPEYVEALCRELRIIGKLIKKYGTRIDTVYFGGGTPTSLEAGDIRTIMECVAESFDLDKIREYSFEAGRPDTMTEEKLRVIKELGATRISVNTQTLNDDVLRVIGRRHSGADFIAAFETARKLGFDNINTDLIAGLPTESYESFRDSLDKVVELSPESITVHTLTIKRSASLFAESSEGSQGQAARMVSYSVEKLMENGYLPYYMYRQKNTVDDLENVGYAKKGFESWYNIFIMDDTQTIMGAGCAASTKLVFPGGRIKRVHNYKFPYEYIRQFDKLMKKKKEAEECLQKISSIPPRSLA